MNIVEKIGDFTMYTREATKLAKELIRFPSIVPPGEYQEIAEYTAKFLRDLGADEVEIVGPTTEKANVIARIHGKGGGPTLMLNGHLDVVPISDKSAWKIDPFSPKVINDKLYGRGAVDMKGQVATMVIAMKALQEAEIHTRGDIVLAFTIDEEEGSDDTGAGYIADKNLAPADYVIVGEPSGLDIVRYHKGVCWFRLVTRGKSCHAGLPENGVNAVEHMVEVIHNLSNTRLTHKPHPVVGSYTMTFNTIRGGTKTNCIADYCEAEIDIRPVPGQSGDQVEEELQGIIDTLKHKIAGLNIELVTLKKRSALDYPDSYPLFDLVKEAVYAVKGKYPDMVGAIANSDAQHFRRKAGIPAVWIGPGLITQNAHCANEYITLEQLEEGVKFFAQAAVTICKV